MEENGASKRFESRILGCALARMGITNVTVSEIFGFDPQSGYSTIYEATRPHEATQTGLFTKRLLLLFVEDQQVQNVLDLIQPTALTDAPEDGVIAVSPLDQLVQIRGQQTAPPVK